MRDLSTFASDRKKANAIFPGPEKNITIEHTSFLPQLRNAYYACSIIIFAQGMVLLQKASDKYHYDLNLESIARIWRGGCIIRSAVLDPIMSAYKNSPSLPNLLFDSYLGGEVGKRQADLRTVVQKCAGYGFPVPALMASLAYYDGYRSEWLPANLIQAQRDYFGAHTYERIDEAGSFHTQWENP